MADLSVLLDVLRTGKQICEEVRRNVFVADRETAEKLRNNCVQLIIALLVATRRMLLDEGDRNFIDENVNLLILEIQKYISMFDERFTEKEEHETRYSCPIDSGVRQGRPKFLIPCQQLEGLRSLGFSWIAIARMLGVSEKTIKRRREEYNMSEHPVLFSDITDDELDSLVKHVLEMSQNSGERMIMGWFKGRGIHIQRWRLREAISRVDPVGRELRRKTVTKRRVYSVSTPNALWHLDGHHKLIQWCIVIHGGIDGFSRSVVFLKASTNNTAKTVLQPFLKATEVFHYPRRIRTDYGTENVEVARVMLHRYGPENNPVLTGKSVHNQRIERLWRDVHNYIVQYFKNIFFYLESVQLLDRDDEVDLFALHYVYLPQINIAIKQFVLQWNNHSLSGDGGYTPLQRWTEGFYRFAQSDYTTVRDILNPEHCNEDYGVDDDGPLSELQTNNHVEVPASTIELTDDEMSRLAAIANPTSNDNNHGIHLYVSARNYVIGIITDN